MGQLNKNHLDVSRIFLTFVTLVGDVERTAEELGIDPEIVRKLADKEEWHNKIQRVCLMSKSGKPGDWERAANRALCFVQAHQIRSLVDKMVAAFQGLTPEEIAEKLSTFDKLGHAHVSARFFADLAAAAQKAHEMSYAALGDSMGERKERASEDNDQLNATALHAAVIAALNNPVVKPAQIIDEVKQLQNNAVKQLSAPDDKMSDFDQSVQKATT